jgi:ech hydrogenase subunit D
MTRSNESTNIADLPHSEILSKAEELAKDGYRVVQICATSKEGRTELLYSFDKDLVMINYRVQVPEGMAMQSITGHFWSAFIFENEVHDLFGVEFTDLVLDYKGNFFRLSSKTPWKTEAKKGVE